MTKAMRPSDLPSLRLSPSIAAAPRRHRPGPDPKRLFPYLLPHRTHWIAIAGVVAVSLVVTVGLPLLSRAAIDGPVRHHAVSWWWVVGFGAAVLGFADATMMFVRRWLTTRATMGVEADIRRDLRARLQILPMSFYHRWQSGHLVALIMTDLSTVRDLMSFGGIFILLNILQITAVTVCLLMMYWPLGVVLLATIVPIVATALRFQVEFTRLSRQARDQSGHIATHVEESALGRGGLLAPEREHHVHNRFDTEVVRTYDVGSAKASVAARFWSNVALIGALGFGAYAAGHGIVSIGTLAAFITMTMSLLWPVTSMGFLLSMTQESMAAADRIAEIFDAPCDITVGPHLNPVGPGRLELRDVGFRVPQPAHGERWLLRHVTLTVEPGETLALVGPAGSGKSLLTALLSRIYDVSEGQILLDGYDVRELALPSLRRVVSTAFEDSTVFSMSVAENLRLDRPDATGAELAEAIDIAAAGFVYDLPSGLDTRIGQHGTPLSSAQRQRLCLARAIVAAPKLLVIDDTLAGLGARGEAEATEALRLALFGVTGIVVTNRLSTALLADRVALLEPGNFGASTITHVGTHAELLAKVAGYRQLLVASHTDDTAYGATD